MKTLRVLLLLTALLLLPMTRPAAAGPATVVKSPEVGCLVAWLGIESDSLPHVILLPANGVFVGSNNARGNALLHCGAQIDFGATTVAVDIETGNLVPVRLLTIDEACALNPDACRGGGNGALIYSFDNTGIPCVFGGAPSTKYSERVTPSGEAQINCHLPE